MQPRSLVALWLLLAAASLQAQEAPAENFRDLFNGQDFTGWQGDDPKETQKLPFSERRAAIEALQEDFKAHWKVVDGVMVHDGKLPLAATTEALKDIELRAEFKALSQDRGGIYLKGVPLVLLGNAQTGSGALVNNTPNTPGQIPLVKADLQYGLWNQVRILQVGSRTSVELNGKKVVDRAIMENSLAKDKKDPLPPAGPIALQSTTGQLRVKNLQVRNIPQEEAIRFLRGDDAAQGFTPLFNGQDLTGWTGAKDDFQVSNGTLSLKGGGYALGTLYTEKPYSNYILRLEFQGGGNSGILLRYNGKGTPTPDNTFCEVQISGDSSEGGAGDAATGCGSAYKLVSAHPGYLRPSGDWNFMEISVAGTRLKVEMNGAVVLNTELKKSARNGYIGIPGQLDSVAFRNIMIKPLR